MSTEKNSKHDQVTYGIKIAARVVQWADFLHQTDEQKLNDFLNEIYGGEGELAEAYITEKREYLRRHGVWAWMHKLDNRNVTRFYNLLLKNDPTNWGLNYSVENRKAMQEMIQDAIETVTDRIEKEVDTQLKQEMEKHGLTPQDLGAEPKETFDEHQDEE